MPHHRSIPKSASHHGSESITTTRHGTVRRSGIALVILRTCGVGTTRRILLRCSVGEWSACHSTLKCKYYADHETHDHQYNYNSKNPFPNDFHLITPCFSQMVRL